MDESALRALVREAVARHLSGTAMSAPPPAPHPSHFRYPVSSGLEVDGPCLIEPAVRCNQCGYCQSHGH